MRKVLTPKQIDKAIEFLNLMDCYNEEELADLKTKEWAIVENNECDKDVYPFSLVTEGEGQIDVVGYGFNRKVFSKFDKGVIKVWDTDEFRYEYVPLELVAKYYHRNMVEYDGIEDFLDVHCISKKYKAYIENYKG